MSRYPSDVSQSVSSPLPSPSISAPKSSNFIALRKLKEADNQLDLMKRRLSALLIKEEKLNRKSQTAIKKIKYHEMIQQMEKREREKKLLYKKEVEAKVETQRRMNSSQRMTRKQKLEQVKNSFQEMKASCYKVERQVSRQLQSRIKFLGQQEQKSRRDMYTQIKKYEAQSRKHYQIYRLDKQSEIRWHKELEHSRLVDEQERREVKREDLVDMEREILQRQARSRQAAERSTSDLKRIIDPRVSLSANRQALKDSMLKSSKNPEEDL